MDLDLHELRNLAEHLTALGAGYHTVRAISDGYVVDRHKPLNFSYDSGIEPETSVKHLRDLVNEMERRVSFARNFLEDLPEEEGDDK